MKFLHLADLHIGKSVNGFLMLNEQRRAFEQVLEYIQAARPDAALVAGDIYDRAVPGVEAVRLFDDFLTGLAGCDISVLIIAGNHDSPERLNYASRLLADKKIHVCGTADKAPRKIILTDEYGDVNFWLMPFVRPDDAAAALEAAEIDYNSRNVLAAHQFFTKPGAAAPFRSESELNPVGGLDAVDCAILERFDYAALGHLHRAQKIGAEHIRYAGSPVKYSFSEWRHEKSFTVVELKEKGDLTITAVLIEPIRDMREIRGALEELIGGKNIDENKNKDKEDYLRVILTDEEEIIDPMGKIRSVYPNVMSLDFENSRTRAEADIPGITADAEQTGQMLPYDLFSEFFLDISGAVMSAEQSEIIKDILIKTGTEAAEES